MDAALLRRWLSLAIAVVAGLGLGVEIWNACTLDVSEGPMVDAIDVLLPRLSLSFEANVPTWFASSLLLLCALAAGRIAASLAAGTPWRRHWWGMTAIFAYASLDEAIGLHEHLGGHFETSGIFYFDWVFFAVAIVGVLAAVFLPFVRALRSTTRVRLIVAGAIYLGGAIAMELPLGWWTEHAGSHSLGYALIDWVEETMELVGASLALVALVAHHDTPSAEATA